MEYSEVKDYSIRGAVCEILNLEVLFITRVLLGVLRHNDVFMIVL